MAQRIDEAWLRERDLRRHDEAKAVLRELRAVVHDVPEKHLPRLSSEATTT